MVCHRVLCIVPCALHCCYCLVTKSCPTVCDPMDCSPPGSSLHGISQARIVEWIAIPFSRGSLQPRDQTQFFRTAGGSFTSWVKREGSSCIQLYLICLIIMSIDLPRLRPLQGMASVFVNWHQLLRIPVYLLMPHSLWILSSLSVISPLFFFTFWKLLKMHFRLSCLFWGYWELKILLIPFQKGFFYDQQNAFSVSINLCEFLPSIMIFIIL